eukprot:31250-Pelagococcus_subviridis.AAC.6
MRRREEKSLRIGVHRADAVVRGPVRRRTHLRERRQNPRDFRERRARPDPVRAVRVDRRVHLRKDVPTPPQRVHASRVPVVGVRARRPRRRRPREAAAAGERSGGVRALGSMVGVELKGVRSGVERRRGSAFTTRTGSYGDQCEKNAPAEPFGGGFPFAVSRAMMSNTTRMDGSVPGGIWAYIRDMYGDFGNGATPAPSPDSKTKLVSPASAR